MKSFVENIDFSGGASQHIGMSFCTDFRTFEENRDHSQCLEILHCGSVNSHN